jgi:hypothetical protein
MTENLRWGLRLLYKRRGEIRYKIENIKSFLTRTCWPHDLALLGDMFICCDKLADIISDFGEK